MIMSLQQWTTPLFPTQALLSAIGLFTVTALLEFSNNINTFFLVEQQSLLAPSLDKRLPSLVAR